jgi:8-oxo-dGTP pyrophosphatase MutT (NUDIX family)
VARKPKVAEPVWPNAGVEAWYRDKLQLIVRAMASDMLDDIRRVWKDNAMGLDALPRYAAGCMFRYGTLVLLLHRTDGQGWAWPGGGVEDGESFLEAVQRECMEEMDHRVEHLAGFMSVIDVQNDFGVGYVTYECPLEATFIPKLCAEHDAYMWIPPQLALAKLYLHPGVRDTLAEYCTTQLGIAQDAKAKPPSQSVLLQRAMHKWGTKWTRRIESMSDRIARDFATKNRNATERAMKSKLAKAGFTVKFKPNKGVTAAYDAVIAENVGLIRSIPQKYLTDVQGLVWRSVMDGSDMETLSKGLQEKYGIAWRRASLIALDQNHKAKAAMERARRLEVGITSAQWLHSHAGIDKRPSHVKAGAEKVVYEVAKGWWDPDEQKWIWPGTLIRCRCTDCAVIPGFG